MCFQPLGVIPSSIQHEHPDSQDKFHTADALCNLAVICKGAPYTRKDSRSKMAPGALELRNGGPPTSQSQCMIRVVRLMMGGDGPHNRAPSSGRIRSPLALSLLDAWVHAMVRTGRVHLPDKGLARAQRAREDLDEEDTLMFCSLVFRRCRS